MPAKADEMEDAAAAISAAREVSGARAPADADLGEAGAGVAGLVYAR